MAINTNQIPMKNLIKLVLAVLFVLTVSCEDYSASKPTVDSAKIVEQVANADGTITVTFLFKCNTRDDVVVWWGTDESNYQNYLDLTSSSSSNEENVTGDYPSGESLQSPQNWNGENTFEKVYPAAGSYKMVIVATNIGDFSDDVKQTVLKQTIQVQ